MQYKAYLVESGFKDKAVQGASKVARNLSKKKSRYFFEKRIKKRGGDVGGDVGKDAGKSVGKDIDAAIKKEAKEMREKNRNWNDGKPRKKYDKSDDDLR